MENCFSQSIAHSSDSVRFKHQRPPRKKLSVHSVMLPLGRSRVRNQSGLFLLLRGWKNPPSKGECVSYMYLPMIYYWA